MKAISRYYLNCLRYVVPLIFLICQHTEGWSQVQLTVDNISRVCNGNKYDLTFTVTGAPTFYVGPPPLSIVMYFKGYKVTAPPQYGTINEDCFDAVSYNPGATCTPDVSVCACNGVTYGSVECAANSGYLDYGFGECTGGELVQFTIKNIPSGSGVSISIAANYGWDPPYTPIYTDTYNFSPYSCCQPVSVTTTSNSPVCIGTTLQLQASAPNGVSWQWSGPSGFTSTQQNPTRSNVTTAHSGNYTVTVTNNVGCTGTKTITATVLPAISIINITSSNLTGTFTLSGGLPQVNGSDYASVTMALQGNPGVTATLNTAPFTHNETLSFSCPQAGTYQVVATDGAGCSGVGTVVVTNGSGGGGQDTVPPCIEWQNTIGGNGVIGEDVLYSIQQTSDGGYILGGDSDSDISGDKTENSQGEEDYWIIKLDLSGNIQWQNTIGGNSVDELYSVQQTSDDGYILGGWSFSNNSGDKTENKQGIGDYWVIKLDAAGNIQWQNTIGGSSWDILHSIQQTTDGGYILGGESLSNISGDKTENSKGNSDYWVIKLDAVGNIEWQKTIGGSDDEVLNSIQQTSDDGYILGGSSNSDISGNKTENSQGDYDYWVIKLDAVGNIQWQKTIGGSLEDKLNSIWQTLDNGYILGGRSSSNISGIKTENSQGGLDFWVVKLDVFGSIQWQNTIGGNSDDDLYSIKQTFDGGYILGGESSSNIGGDKTEDSYSVQDYWLVKLSPTGIIQWQETIGGSGADFLRSLQQTSDGGYILGGSSRSNISGDKTENNLGYGDYWVVKLTYPTLPTCQSVLILPSPNSIDIAPDTTLTWQPADGCIDGYLLTLSTTPGGSDLLDSLDIGNVTTYQPAQPLPAGQTIYVRITPYNSLGAASGCQEFQFTTIAQCTTVTTTAPSGPGSLRAALDCANTNPGPDTIRFNIPGPGPHTILLEGTPLFFSGDNTVLDATTQPGWYSGSIVIQNNTVPAGEAGLYVNASGARIYGLSVRGFSYGIGIDATDCIIGDYGKGNHIVGDGADPNSGIIIWNSSDIDIRGNIIGLNTAATMPEGALECCAIGLSGAGAVNVRIEGNHLGSNPAGRSQTGVDLRGNNITVLDNLIGTDSSGAADFGFARGINAWSPGVSDVWILQNTVAHSDTTGIRLIAGAQRVKMSLNSLYCNRQYGIYLNPDVNGNIVPPVIFTVDPGSISGTATAFDTVEIFRNGNTTCPSAVCQGRDYLGTAVANAAGNWSLAAPFVLPLNPGDQITATATGNLNNTSAFASCLISSMGCTTDSLALVALYNATGGPSWTNKTNWLQPNQPISTWYGVHTNASGCVDTLLLDGNNLQNSLPAELGNFSGLQRLLLSNNNLSGNIPKELGRLSTLTELNLSQNPQLSGPVTDSLQHLINLRGLYLNQTGLSGPIPDWLGDLSNLRFVNLSVMPNLGGAIPANIGNLIALQKLYLNNSELKGGLPASMNNLINLNLLNVSVNYLDQTLPAMSGMAALDSFFINQNRFTFEDFRPQISFFNGLNRFLYSAQDSVYTDTTIVLNAGQPLTIDLGFDAAIGDNSYLWDKDGQALAPFIGNNQLTFSNLKKSDEGIYHVQVTNTAAPDLTLLSRAVRIQVICNNPPLPQIEGPSALCDGSATLTVSGTYPMLPVWSNNQSGQFITTTGSGPFTVTVTDANGCTGTATRNLGGLVPSPTPAISGPVALCDGSATLAVSGTYPMLPVWSNNQSGQSITTVASGPFTVTVTDANGCTGTATQNVGGLVSSPTPTISGPVALCDGSATLTVSGTYPMLPAWSNNQSGQFITTTGSGLFTVTVTDANGCTGTATQNVSGFEPSPTPAISGPTALCDGSATLTVSGTYPMLPVWSNNQSGQFITATASGPFTVTVTDANGCTGTATQNVGGFAQPPTPAISGPTALCSGSVTLIVSGTYPENPQWSNGQSGYAISVSAPGPYTVTVKDANGCTGTDAHAVSNQGSPVATATPTPAGCDQTNGSINLTVSGGTPGYNFLWNTGATNEDLLNLGLGTYSVTVTDTAQCTTTAMATVGNPNAPNASADPNPSDCDQPTGSIDLSVTGGTPGYTYLWSNGDTDQDPNNLPAGTYTVTVTDAANCSTVTSATVEHPDSPVAGAVANPAGCSQSDGSIDLTVSDGTPGYSYLWSNGDTIQDPANLPAGPYAVTVTDDAGCTTTTATTVTNPNAPTAGTQSAAATCGLSNGSVDLEVNGGTLPYQYLWSNGSMSEDLSGVPADIYTVTVTDSASCSVIVSEEVDGPQPIDTANFLITCNSATGDYAVSFVLTGGTFPYSLLSGNGTVTDSTFESQPITSGASYSFNFDDAADCPFNVSGSHECNCVANAGTMTSVPLKACGDAVISADHNTSQLFVPPGALLLYTLHQGSGAALVNPIAWNVAPVFNYVPVIVYGETYYISAVVGQQIAAGNINVNDPCLSVAPGTPVVFLQESEVEFTAVICEGGGYTVGDSVYTSPGTYTDTLENSVGCDSIVHLKLEVRSPKVELGADTTVCINTKLTINAGVSDCFGCSYQWSEPGLQGSQGMVLPADTTTYVLTITDNEGCSAQADIQVNVVNPVKTPMAATLCNGEEIVIAGKTFNTEGEYDIPQTSATGCIDTIHLTIKVLEAHQFFAVADTFFCPPGDGSVDHHFHPTANDTISSNGKWKIAIVNAPGTQVAGNAGINTDSTRLIYRLSDLSFRGLDTVVYELCDAECTGACSTARVYIVVQDDIEKVADELPNGFTPNGDGINDYFNPLQNYLDQNYIVPAGRVSLTILNRWGEIVYQANPYQYFNELEGGWDGRNNNGNLVSAGTYYFMLRIEVGETVVVKGPVQVLTD